MTKQKYLYWDSFKHNLKWDTKLGKTARKFVCWTAYNFIKAARRMLRWSLGRCSWCGCNPGFSSSVSSRGLRCVELNRNCENQP